MKDELIKGKWVCHVTSCDHKTLLGGGEIPDVVTMATGSNN